MPAALKGAGAKLPTLLKRGCRRSPQLQTAQEEAKS